MTFSANMENLSMEDKQKLETLHEKEIEIFDEFVRICDANNLKYYLYGGTLLGAVRHGGFIPWDDDMDIIMPRDDYEKFGEYCKTELSEKYFYQTCFTDPDFPMLYAKIRLKNSYVKEDKWGDLNLHKGIYIDILPLDNFPSDIRKGRSLLKKVWFFNRVAYLNNINKSRKGMNLAFKIFPRDYSYNMRKKLLAKSHSSDGENVCSFGSHYKPLQKRILQKSWFDGNEYMAFEGKQYRVPCGWKEYLVHLFGESYMELPPVEKRVVHFNFSDVQFDTAKED